MVEVIHFCALQYGSLFFKREEKEHIQPECLPLVQGVFLGSWDRVSHRAPGMEPVSLSAYVSAFLCVSHE